VSGDSSSAPLESTFVVSGEVPAQTITRSLQALLPTRHHQISRQRFTLLDTIDGRVGRAAARLTQSSVDGHTIISWKATRTGSELAVHLPQPASFAWDFPECALYRALAPVIGPRRLLPQAEAEESGSLLDVLDDRGKTVARVRIESGCARLPTPRAGWRPLPTMVTVSGLRGYSDQYERLVPIVQSRPGIRVCPEGVQGLIRRHAGAPEPQDVSSLRLDLAAGVRADVGASRIHLALLDVMLANEAGVRADIDSEFLHDFRVAVRRTRSLLGQIRQVFGEDAVAHFSSEFSWLGKLTGPPRDLDVLILTLRERRREVSFEGLEAVIERLEEMRCHEYVRLVEALRGDRFHRLTSEWKAFLNQPIARHPLSANASRRLADVVYERAWRLSRKIGGRAADLDEATPAEAVHELRVKAKKLRYLVDVVPGSGEDGNVKRVLVALKALQRVLGDFNDAHVQEQRLIECRGAMAAKGAGDDSLIAIGRLAEQARERAAQLRSDVVAEARRFGGRTVRSACRTAFKRTRNKASIT
jgi:CHAD domain-containing protein